MKCNQDNCTNKAHYRFTWPGKDEAGICKDHAVKLEAIASSIGLHLQLVPLAKEIEK